MGFVRRVRNRLKMHWSAPQIACSWPFRKTQRKPHKKPAPTTNRRVMTAKSGRNLALTGAVGVLIAAYGVYVEHQKKAHPGEYSALCDSQYFSCSKVMASEYGSMLSYHGLVEKGSSLDFPNALIGMFAYALFALYPLLQVVPFHPHLYVAASSVAMFVSVYLAYILAFVLKNVCLVCFGSYIVNILLFWNSLQVLYDYHVAVMKKSTSSAIKKKAN